MNFLIKRGKKSIAHVWYGNRDTLCEKRHQLNMNNWTIIGNNTKNRICKMCIAKLDVENKRQAIAFNASLPQKKKRKTAKHVKQSGSCWEKSKAFLASWEWRTLRYEVITEFGRRCMCCGATPDDGRTVIHVDHIKPRYKYPKLALVKSNLQILCGVCNQGKGAWDETDFRHCVEDEDERLEREFQIELADKATTLQ